MNEMTVSLKNIDKFQNRKAYAIGSSIVLTLTGLVELGKEYVCWEDEKTGDVIIRKKEL